MVVAKEALTADSANVQLNFIRDLGSAVEYTFPRSSQRMKPAINKADER